MNRGDIMVNNKFLVGILSFLCIAIVGLSVGIAVVRINQSQTANSEEMTAERIAYNDYVADFDKVKAKSAELVKKSSVSASEIINLYSPYIEKCLADKAVDRATAYIRAEKNALVEAGFKREALDEMLKIDYSVFVEAEQHKYYLEIMELAKDLNDSDVVAKYEPLAASTKEAYDKNYAASERAAAEGAAAREKAKGREVNSENN
ncbi:hypothetical protein IKF21_02120 [Candidatus Saccharibacteria bacterium]|nr:hypothetical protein [Candidatus Saccharibacteria bacterium]